LKLLIWNAQGAKSNQGGMIVEKWELVWKEAIKGFVEPGGPADNFAFLMCEAGRAPWIDPNSQVNVNSLYALDLDSTHCDQVLAGNSEFSQGVLKARNRKAFWFPWLKTLNTNWQNSRCSLGGFYAPSRVVASSWIWGGALSNASQQMVRPALRVETGPLGFGLTTLMVHLEANQPGALAEFAFLLQSGPQLFSGSPVLVVGDLNIDLLKFNIEGWRPGKPALPVAVPPGWRWLSCREPTHRGGAEYDWAILFDPKGKVKNVNAKIVKGPSVPAAPTWNVSDHALMEYEVN
jgi:hypothetical protein